MPSTIYKSPTGVTTAVCPGGEGVFHRDFDKRRVAKSGSYIRGGGDDNNNIDDNDKRKNNKRNNTTTTIWDTSRPGRQRPARPLARPARDNRSPAAVATPPIRGMLRPRGPCGARPLAPVVADGCHRTGATPPPVTADGP